MCNECSCARPVRGWKLPLAQRVTADSKVAAVLSPGAPDWPLAWPGGIGGVAAPVPPGQLYRMKRARRTAGPLRTEKMRALADLRLAELDAHVELLARHRVGVGQRDAAVGAAAVAGDDVAPRSDRRRLVQRQRAVELAHRHAAGVRDLVGEEVAPVRLQP